MKPVARAYPHNDISSELPSNASHYNAARERGAVGTSHVAHSGIVNLSECCFPRLAHPGNDGDSWPRQDALCKLGLFRVVQDAEEAKLLTVRTGGSYFVIAAHRAMHGFPLAAAGKRWGRGCRNC